jgi:hypothetical protein
VQKFAQKLDIVCRSECDSALNPKLSLLIAAIYACNLREIHLSNSLVFRNQFIGSVYAPNRFALSILSANKTPFFILHKYRPESFSDNYQKHIKFRDVSKVNNYS